MARFAGAVLSAVVGLFSISLAQKDETAPIDAVKNKMLLVKDANGEYSLEGGITDALGAVIPGAKLMLYKEKDKPPVASTASDDQGYYSFSSLPEGTYWIEIPAVAGFQKQRVENIQIYARRTTVLNIQLFPRNGTELVGVVAEDSIDLSISGPTPTHIDIEMINRLPIPH